MTHLQRFYYTITSSRDAADLVVERFRSNGMVAGKMDLLYGGHPSHVWLAAGIWMSASDLSPDQYDDWVNLTNQSSGNEDPDYFVISTEQQQLLVNWIRKTYQPFLGNRITGPGTITAQDIWNFLTPYYVNPAAALWTFMSVKNFFIVP